MRALGGHCAYRADWSAGLRARFRRSSNSRSPPVPRMLLIAWLQPAWCRRRRTNRAGSGEIESTDAPSASLAMPLKTWRAAVGSGTVGGPRLSGYRAWFAESA